MHHPHRLFKTKPGSLEEAIIRVVHGTDVSEATEQSPHLRVKRTNLLRKKRATIYDNLAKISSLSGDVSTQSKDFNKSIDMRVWMKWEKALKKIEELVKETKPFMVDLKKEIK